MEEHQETNTKMIAELEYVLKVPPDVMFPLQLNTHLKKKIETIVEEKWELLEKIQCMQVELRELHKYKDETKETMEAVTNGSNSMMSTRFIEISKKNRDMTWQIESMKSKIQKLLTENEVLHEKTKNYESSANANVKNGGPGTLPMEDSGANPKVEDEVSNLNQQLTKATTKMMEYRRQNQVIQMELKTAIRALAQEVGEGVTPKTVLKEVSAVESTWRGRQQQILALQQKVTDLQHKLAVSQQETTQAQHSLDVGSEGELKGSGDGQSFRKGEKKMSKIPTLIQMVPVIVSSSASKRCLDNLQQQDKKKHEQIEKLTQELEATKVELKVAKGDIRGSKARNQVLEGQIRSLRIDLEESGLKLGLKRDELQQSMEEVKEMRLELVTVREREKKLRESSSVELHEANQTIARERAVVVRLQGLLSEKQEQLQNMDTEMTKMQADLQIYAASSGGTLEAAHKIKNLESQLQYATQSIQDAEKERGRLMAKISNAASQIEDARHKQCDMERLLAKSFAVMKRADACIDTCLDAAEVTSRSVLQEVEAIRTLIRQINAGNQNCWEALTCVSDDPKHLKLQVTALTKEVCILQEHLRKSNSARGKDIRL